MVKKILRSYLLKSSALYLFLMPWRDLICTKHPINLNSNQLKRDNNKTYSQRCRMKNSSTIRLDLKRCKGDSTATRHRASKLAKFKPFIGIRKGITRRRPCVMTSQAHSPEHPIYIYRMKSLIGVKRITHTRTVLTLWELWDLWLYDYYTGL